jgi:predicted phosphodiesterase
MPEAGPWGLVADVHGNRPALEAALDRLRQAGATRLAFLGDYLGRGDPDWCAAHIRSVADLAVVGNRDLDWQDRVAPRTRAWVLSLPRVAQSGRLLVAHGDARLTPRLSTGDIKRDFLRAWQVLVEQDAAVFAFGHSHQARLWRKAAPTAPAEPITAQVAALDPQSRYFLNVGTTGLPFPGKGGPSVALVDFAAGRIIRLDLDRRR